jgi:hypothetical protein
VWRFATGVGLFAPPKISGISDPPGATSDKLTITGSEAIGYLETTKWRT